MYLSMAYFLVLFVVVGVEHFFYCSLEIVYFIPFNVSPVSIA